MRGTLILVSSMLLAGTSANAFADATHYVGSHPGHGGKSYCYIEAPHVHAYGPKKKHRVLYREHADHLHFVGDPVAHSYDGSRHRYHGHHPIAASSHVHVAEAPDAEFFCYIDGPHFHAVAPAPSLRFELAGNAYWYAGPVPAQYAQARVTYRPMTRFYARAKYARPVVEVEPPAAYVFAEVVAPVPAVEVVATAPAASASAGVGFFAGVELAVPTVHVEVGGPVVVAEGHMHPGHGHYRRGHKHKKYKRKKHKRYRKKGKKRRYRNRVHSSRRRDFRSRRYRD